MLAESDHGVSRVDELTVTPATASVPSGPTNLTATTGTGSVTLHWTASSGGTRPRTASTAAPSPDGEATTPVGTVSGTTTTFTDTGLTNRSTYFYMVVANNAAGNSPDSNEVMTTPGITPPSGTNLALNQPAYASSIQGAGYPATAAVDNNWTPLVQRVRPTRSGCWSISVRRTRSARSPCTGNRPTARRSRSRRPRRGELDDDLLHHHRDRRHPDAPAQRIRAVRPLVRHRPGHRLRLLTVGIPGIRHLTVAAGLPPLSPNGCGFHRTPA